MRSFEKSGKYVSLDLSESDCVIGRFYETILDHEDLDGATHFSRRNLKRVVGILQRQAIGGHDCTSWERSPTPFMILHSMGEPELAADLHKRLKALYSLPLAKIESK